MAAFRILARVPARTRQSAEIRTASSGDIVLTAMVSRSAARTISPSTIGMGNES
jgi:hypothetical protein